MLKIGITGGIGSGKSEVCLYFNQLNIASINADEIAKNVIHVDKSIQNQLREKFGDNIFISKKLNTNQLASIVFTDKKKLAILNSIIHPKTIEEIKKEIFLLSEKKHTYILIESAIIFENNLQNMFDYTLLVTSNLDLRIERIKLKTNLREEDILKRIKMQMNEESKKKISDFIIENNETKLELKQKVTFFHKIFSAISRTKK